MKLFARLRRHASQKGAQTNDRSRSAHVARDVPQDFSSSGSDRAEGSSAGAPPPHTHQDQDATPGASAGPHVPRGVFVEQPGRKGGTSWYAIGHACPDWLARTTWTVDAFEPVRQLGKGAKSRVWEARDTATGNMFVLKAYDLRKVTPAEAVQLQRETKIHATLPPHPNVVTFYAGFVDERACYVLMERCGNDLYHSQPSMSNFSEARVVHNVVAPGLRGLAHLHTHGFLHRDIKPENFIYGLDGVLRIADLGFAIDTRKYRPTTRLGTLEFMAPEVVSSGRRADGSVLPRHQRPGYDSTADVWSFGAVVYEVLVGKSPFGRNDADRTSAAIAAGKVVVPIWLSEEARSFLSLCLERDPARRPTARELLDHPWLARLSGSHGGPHTAPRSVSRWLSSHGGGQANDSASSVQYDPQGQKQPPAACSSVSESLFKRRAAVPTPERPAQRPAGSKATVQG
ncbi:unnamed protein product [Pedinophyceae sp. YPF-701]|nr:unnamed protein product [Pedinophyceae sp. YPF-701]